MVKIAHVPPEIAVAIVSYLQPRELLPLAFASKTLVESAFCNVCFRRQLQLHVPQGHQQITWRTGENKPAPLLLHAIPSTMVIYPASQLPKLHSSVAARIESLVVVLVKHHKSKPTLRMLSQLAVFPSLTRLDLCNHTDTALSLDVGVLARATPQLQTLRTENVHILVPESTPKLRQLRWLDVTRGHMGIIDIPRLVSQCPQLQGLRSRYGPKFDSGSLQNWPPLTSLDLCTLHYSDELLHAIQSVHLSTLHRLALRGTSHWDTWPQLNLKAQDAHPYPLRELEVPLPILMLHWAALTSLSFLRVLRLVGSHTYTDTPGLRLDDATPLASLPLLEELSFGLTSKATNCRALRALSNLRVLHMTDGWLRDFIQSTPRLETLHCDKILRERRTFQQRSNDGNDSPPTLAWIREVHVALPQTGKSVVLNDYAFQILAQASVVKVAQDRMDDELLERLCALPQLTSLHVRETHTHRTNDTAIWPHLLASVSMVTTLRFEPVTADHVVRCPWHLRSATQLRALEIWYAQQLVVDAIGRWADSLVCLEEVRLQCYRGSNVKPLARLVRLRVAEIPKGRCNDLRDAIQQGELQQLTQIYHGNTNCLHFDTCSQ